MRINAILVSCLLGLSMPVFAPHASAQSTQSQEGSVSGTVIDENGEPVIGATVKVKGNVKLATVTDLDGNFTLKTGGASEIEVTYVGYLPAVVNVVGKNNVEVSLVPTAAALEEVVVVGYGVQKKATMTGAVTAIGGEKLENKGSLSSPVQALQGQVPGVIITRNSSAPGDESWSMSLRGAVSKNSTEPLIIIDGIEYESVNELRLINPSDIESINFLKDAAASIYGSKAAGGVVLVTTKKAKDNNFRVEYSGSVTGKFIGLTPKLMSLDQWSDAVIQARTNDGFGMDDTWIKYAILAQKYKNQYIDFSNSGNPFGGAFSDTSDITFFDTDWNDIMWGDSWSTQHELSLSGGRQGSTFRLSLGYMHDDSNLKWGNNNNNRYNFRLSNNIDFTDRFHLVSVVGYNRQDQVAPTEIGKALTTSSQQPGFPSSTKDGKPYGWGTWATPNWIAELGGDNKLKVSAVNISENLTYDIWDTLKAHIVLGYNTSTATRDKKSMPVDFYNYAGDKKVLTTPSQSASYYEKSSSRTDFYSVQAYLDWNHTFAQLHNLKVMGGWQYNLKEYDYVNTTAKDIQASLDVINGSGDVSTKANKWQEAIMSYYGRVNYDYDSKYLLEGQLRYDGSSKFQAENRWAAFWGASVGWRLAQEKFMEWSSEWLNEFKIRASYGNVGNQSGIDRYSGVLLYNYKQGDGVLIGGNKVSYIDTNGKLVSFDRTWERVHNYNIGVDFGFLNNRLSGTVEWFNKRTNNMLIDVLYPGILGDKAPTANRGKFKAWGYEGQITWRDKIGNVEYYIGGTYTYADNKLVDNGGSGAIKSGMRSDREGYPLNSIFGFRYVGKIQNQEQLDKYVGRYEGNYSGDGNISLLRLGDNMYQDVNGDGRLDENDFVYLGSNDPKIQYSFNFGANWKGLDISCVFQGAAKRTVWRVDGNGNADIWKIPMRAVYMNSSNHWYGNVWSAETPDNRYPTLTNQSGINTYNYQCSSWSVEDGSYLRLKNITIGYTFPSELIQKTKLLSSLRVYLTGTDLWEWSKINDGWDPEASNKVSNANRYPFLRNVTFGLNLSF